jgi:outer membrane lipoprotein-sorting protein
MKFSRRSRWAVPAGAAVITGAAIAAVPALTALTSAQAAPALPGKTPAQLLAQLASAHQPPPMSGTVTETVALGLPKLPDTGDAVNSPTSLLTGSHTLNLWYGGPKHFRIALPQQMRETDIYRDGSTAWLWQSSGNDVTKFVLPSGAGTKQALPPAAMPLTPQQAASDALALAGKTTRVSVASNLTVAGRAAYDLALQPKDTRSLIGQVTIAIDAGTSVPLQVQVFARGATSPAITVGFTHVSFAAPAAGDLTFTPPPTAKVTTTDLSGAGKAHTGAAGSTSEASPVTATGSGWLSVAEFPESTLQAVTGSNPVPGSATGVQGASAQETQAAIRALFNDATPVHGAWGSGTLLRTSLLSVLIANGKVYAGAVDPSVLYAAAAAGT